MKRPPEYKAFYHQQWCAKLRGIAWELTFEQWLGIWQASGHFHERGRNRGQYVMSRLGDTGPYAVGNVSIKRTEENLAEGAARVNTAGKPKSGAGRGVYFKYPGAPRPWIAARGATVIGFYETEAEAIQGKAAYDAEHPAYKPGVRAHSAETRAKQSASMVMVHALRRARLQPAGEGADA